MFSPLPHTPTNRLKYLCVTLFAAVAGCGDDSTEPQVPDVGSLSFQYTGERSGIFTATGDPPQDVDAPLTSFAAAEQDEEFLTMAAFQPTAPQTGNMFVLLFDEVPRRGVYDLDVLACDDFGGSGSCIFGILEFDVDLTAPDTILDLDSLDLISAYLLVSGQVRVEEISTQHIRGSFSGEAVTLDFDAFDPELPDAGDVIMIRDGRFEVPIGTGATAQGSVRPARIPRLSRWQAARISAGKL